MYICAAGAVVSGWCSDEKTYLVHASVLNDALQIDYCRY